jgi:hypothetical protein
MLSRNKDPSAVMTTFASEVMKPSISEKLPVQKKEALSVEDDERVPEQIVVSMPAVEFA